MAERLHNHDDTINQIVKRFETLPDVERHGLLFSLAMLCARGQGGALKISMIDDDGPRNNASALAGLVCCIGDDAPKLLDAADAIDGSRDEGLIELGDQPEGGDA